MKTFFSLVNFVAGILALLIGFGNLLFLDNSSTGDVAGAAATVVGVAFLWVATAAMFSRPQQG